MSWLRKAFGNENGEMLEGIVAMVTPILFMVAFILVIKLMIFVSHLGNSSQDNKIDKALTELPENSKEVITEIVAVNKKTAELLKKLETDLSKSDKALNEKKREIAEMEKKVRILTLTPEQRQLVQEYNKTVSNTNLSIVEWIRQKAVWYDIAATILISIIFYWLGRRSIKKKTQMT
jgi:septal ring factor EnvC (AmiA/AmiB activator)